METFAYGLVIYSIWDLLTVSDMKMMYNCVGTVMRTCNVDETDRVQFGDVTAEIEQCF
jgi:hypothetical protein